MNEVQSRTEKKHQPRKMKITRRVSKKIKDVNRYLEVRKCKEMSRQMKQVKITTGQTRRAAETVGASPPNGIFEAPGPQLASQGEEKIE